MENNDKKMIVCVSCAAEYDSALVRCPYCGTTYAPAEEKEYMGQLEDIRKDLEGHKDAGDKSLKKGLGAVVRIAVLVIVVIMILLFGSMWLSGIREKNRSESKKAEFLKEQGITTQEDSGE